MRKTLIAITFGLTALTAAACGNGSSGSSTTPGGAQSLAPIQSAMPSDTLASPSDMLASPSDMLASPSDMLASPSESPAAS